MDNPIIPAQTIEHSVDLMTVYGLRIIAAVLILIAGHIVGNWANKGIAKIKKLDDTLKSFLGGLAKYSIFAVALITVLSQFGVQTASLIAVLGAAGLAIGLALQGTLSNVAAGVMLLILRPFNVGDYVTFSGHGGTVKALGLFGTEMATPDNIYVFVPNSTVWNAEIYNYSRNGYRRQDIVVGISYGDDVEKAMKILQDAAAKEPRLLNTDTMKSEIMVTKLNDFSVDLIVRVWTLSSDYWQVQWDLTKAIKQTLDHEGITIPFPTRTLYMTEDKSSKKNPPIGAGS